MGVTAKRKSAFAVEPGLVGYYRISLMAVCVGVVLGALAAGRIPAEVGGQVGEEFLKGIEALKGGQTIEPSALTVALIKNAAIVLIISLFGMTVYGTIPILICLAVRGYISGFAVAYVVQTFSWQGITYAACSILPQGLVIFPAIICMAVVAMEFSRSYVRRRSEELKPRVFGYAVLVALALTAAGAAALVEVYLCPQLIRLV